jgi:hypothetical protein
MGSDFTMLAVLVRAGIFADLTAVDAIFCFCETVANLASENRPYKNRTDVPLYPAFA